MITDFIDQCKVDEERGLLPEGYTEDMIKQMEIKQ